MNAAYAGPLAGWHGMVQQAAGQGENSVCGTPNSLF
jgi:hypothetical protein